MNRKTFTALYENLIGIRDDNGAKLLRIIFFAVLITGIFWAGFNFYQAFRISNLQRDSYMHENFRLPSRNDGESSIANRLRALISMRQGGKILASSMNEMNRRLFNEDASYLTESESRAESRDLTASGNSESLQITVRAIMISGRERSAIIDTPGAKGIIIRQGSRISALNAIVTRINKDGVIFRINGQNYLASFGQNQTGGSGKDSQPADKNFIPTQLLQEALKLYQELHGSRR